MRVTIDKTPDEGSDTADFIETEMKELSNLHFKATTTSAPATTTHVAATQALPETQAGDPPSVTKSTAEPEAEPQTAKSSP